jgi:hypothetical protein
MASKKIYLILSLITVIWLLELLPIVKSVLNFHPIVYPRPNIPKTRLTGLVCSSAFLSGLCVCLGALELREKEVVKNRSGSRLLVMSVLFLLTTPFVYAYIFQQNGQNFTQTILNIPLMDQDFDDLPPGSNPPDWSPIGGAWATVEDNGNIVYYQDDNADKEALSISATGNTTWTDYTFNVDVKFVEGNTKRNDRGALLLFRYQGGNNYYFVWMKEYIDKIELHNHGDGAHMIDSVDCVLIPDTWYHVVIRIVGNTVDVYINGISYFNHVDMGSAFNTGSVAVGTSYYKVMFDFYQLSVFKSILLILIDY